MKRLACLMVLLLSQGLAAQTGSSAVAIFAGGCFWCTEADFDKVPGVLATTSGYIGGSVAAPTYEQVSAGNTGHIEAVQVTFDPTRVSYQDLLEAFWPSIDPLDGGGQFCDRGEQYRSAIFWLDRDQQEQAQASLNALQASGRLKGNIATLLLPAGRFWPAEAYHQDYASRNPLRYRYYRSRCGRDARLHAVWGQVPP